MKRTASRIRNRNVKVKTKKEMQKQIKQSLQHVQMAL